MNENVHALIGAYAVDAVSPAERVEFEAHLGACDDCSVELVGMREAAAVLAEAEAVAPPASLKGRVMESIAQTPQLAPLTSDDAASPDADPASTVPAEGAPSAVPLASSRKRLWPRLALAAASAAVLAVGGLVGSSLVERRQDDLALEKDVMMVTSAPDAHSMDLGLGTAHLVVSEKMESVVAMGDDCPHPKDGMSYQLWLVMDDGTKEAGPTFMPDEDGTFMAIMEMDMEGAAAIAVTEEPMGGSAEPTSAEVAVVEL
ncbi:anti-sigma factor [Demequina mangrovi]|uniref:Regulator of SigK n=1 Tax=Demequina mangrovi TaxID=1043493 RepID=A0A1H6ZGX6_9MICO|nr:anti-sigma factor [Demequina mangrovi]SEJ50757.1 Putative zinc-finger [Demequina mangrovi]